MENITPDEVRQMDMDRLASKIAEVRHDDEYVDILDNPPQIGCTYEIKLLGKELGSCLCVKDRTSTQTMFVSANGNSLIGCAKEKSMLHSYYGMYVRSFDSNEIDEDWTFRGTLFKIDLDRVQPHDIMLKLLK